MREVNHEALTEVGGSVKPARVLAPRPALDQVMGRERATIAADPLPSRVAGLGSLLTVWARKKIRPCRFTSQASVRSAFSGRRISLPRRSLREPLASSQVPSAIAR